MPVGPLRRPEDRADVERRGVETADARERLPQDRLFGIELGRIVEMLPSAAAALRHVRARGHATRGGRLENPDELSLSIVALAVDDAFAAGRRRLSTRSA